MRAGGQKLTNATPLYLGADGEPGMYLIGPGGRGSPRWLSYERARALDCLDSNYPPRLARDGSICWTAQFERGTREWSFVRYDAPECPQGQFLHHEVLGFSILSWWDRTQGDARAGINSNVLLEGSHDVPELLHAFRMHFPRMNERLTAAGIVLVDAREVFR